MDRARLIAQLTRDEGLQLKAYDDANGNPIRPGVLMQGNPTIGIGRALNTNGITQEEAEYLLNNDIDRVYGELAPYLWFASLNDVRQNALVNMGFNIGVGGLLGFHDMIAALSSTPPDYEAAANAMEDSRWYRQVGARAARLVQAIRTGVSV